MLKWFCVVYIDFGVEEWWNVIIGEMNFLNKIMVFVVVSKFYLYLLFLFGYNLERLFKEKNG